MNKSFTAEQIAQLIGGKIEGNKDTEILSFAKIEEAKLGDIAFLGNEKYVHWLDETKASVIIFSESLFKDEYKGHTSTFILVEDAYRAMNTLLEMYQKMTSEKMQFTKHASAIISENAQIHEECHIGALTVIEDGAVIEKNVTIKPQCYIGKNVTIGENTLIYPGVRILENCKIGSNVIIHANAVIGADGFGYVPDEILGYKKTPQLGNVIVDDYAEIGANTTIDRASMGSTTIGKGVKIDNLVQIAHNVRIGQYTAIAAQAGISGSTKIGAKSIIGGQAGIVGHIQLAEGSKINAQSGVSKSIKEDNTSWTGSPAGPYHQTLKSQLLVRKLPEIVKRIEALEKRNEGL